MLTTKPLLFFMLWACAFGSLQAQDDTRIRTTHFNTKEGIALAGYDPVSYFDNGPLKGKRAYAHTYRGITYWFSSRKNLEAFRQSPAQYEPAFGGWCAYAMGESSEKVKIDPKTYTIQNGKLCLFYNFWWNNTLESWNEDKENFFAQAEKRWAHILEMGE